MAEFADPEDVAAPDLRDYGRTIWRHRKMVVITAIIAVGAALALSLTQAKSYQATAQIIIQPATAQDIVNGSAQSADATARAVATETAVLQSNVVKDAATKALGHEPSIGISSDSSTSDVVNIDADASTGKVAASDANGFARTYIAYSRQQSIDNLIRAGQQIQASLDVVESKIPTLPRGSSELAAAQQQQTLIQQQLNQVELSTSLNKIGGARMLSVATVPTAPAGPKPIRNVAIALILGLLLGLGLAFLRELLDDKIASREDLERATPGLPVLGQIPRVDAWRKVTGRLAALDSSDKEESAAEAYRTLRTSIQFLGVDEELRTVQITSPSSGEGKTLTVANLAIAFARAGKEVAVVCCDLRRPRVHELFGLSNDVGFTTVLLGEAQVSDALQVVTGLPNLTVLAAGPPAPNPSELLGTTRAKEAIATLAETADIVLIDSSPILPVSDALVVSGMSDATIVVASARTTTRRSIRRALELLRQVDASLVGTVLNNGDVPTGSGYAPYPSVGAKGKQVSLRQVPAPQRASN